MGTARRLKYPYCRLSVALRTRQRMVNLEDKVGEIALDSKCTFAPVRLLNSSAVGVGVNMLSDANEKCIGLIPIVKWKFL